MASIEPGIPEGDVFVLTKALPGPSQKLLAITVVLGVLAAAGCILWQFAGTRVRSVEAVVPIYLTAMIVTDVITAVLLFAQFSILRTRALLIIANGYTFTALITIPYSLTFPGLFESGRGLIGNLQSSEWIYVLWHCGFATFVLGFAASKDLDLSTPYWRTNARRPIVLSVALTAAIVLAATYICVASKSMLPAIMIDYFRYGETWPYYVGAPIASLCICALIILWIRRHTVLGLWLMVVMCLNLAEIPLSFYTAPIRFDIGWYTVKVIDLTSSVTILVVLLYEISTLYARLLHAVLSQRREREARLVTGDAVAATIVHEIKQPLSAMITRAETGLRRLEQDGPDLNKVKEGFKQIAADGRRAGEIIDGVRANFKKDSKIRAPIDVNALIAETVALVRDDLRERRIWIDTKPDVELPRIIGDRIQLQQVLLNLITNAIDSMSTEEGVKVLSVTSQRRDDSRVLVSVADTGSGVSPENAERVFNPLFTTKSGGMGMGLSICRSIIEAHDGRLWVVPNTPNGAIFQFALSPSE